MINFVIKNGARADLHAGSFLSPTVFLLIPSPAPPWSAPGSVRSRQSPDLRIFRREASVHSQMLHGFLAVHHASSCSNHAALSFNSRVYPVFNFQKPLYAFLPDNLLQQPAFLFLYQKIRVHKLKAQLFCQHHPHGALPHAGHPDPARCARLLRQCLPPAPHFSGIPPAGSRCQIPVFLPPSPAALPC